MSDNNWDIDVDHEDYEDAPRALRDAYRALKKQYQTVTTERDDFKGKWQARSATDALADYGFRNTKRVSRDLLADGVDLSDADAVKAWVQENGDDYARGETTTQGSQPEQSEDHTAEAGARRQLSSTAGMTSPAHMDKFKAAQAEITPEMDGEAVARVYAKHGI